MSRASGVNCLRRATLAAIAILSIGPVPAQGEVECERGTISAVVSPDDVWVALVREGVCSDGRFVTVSTDTVQLVRRDMTDTIHLASSPDKPDHDNDILVVDDYGHPENRPLTQWLSSRKLQITIPNISGIGLQKGSYQGVDIVLKYEPNDPPAREKWQKERALMPK